MDYILVIKEFVSIVRCVQTKWCIFRRPRRKCFTRRTGNISSKWLFYAHSGSAKNRHTQKNRFRFCFCLGKWICAHGLFVFVKHVLSTKPYNFILSECFHVVSVCLFVCWFWDEILLVSIFHSFSTVNTINMFYVSR